MKRVAIESPYKATDTYTVEENEAFAEAVSRWASVVRHVNPFAMHLFFTRFLNDQDANERRLGIESGLGWTDLAEEVWFCLRDDEPLTSGMLLAVERNKAKFPERPMWVLRFQFEEGALELLEEMPYDWSSYKMEAA